MTPRNARGIKRHRIGTVVSFGRKEPEVAFDAVDGEGEAAQTVFFPLASLQPHQRPGAKKTACSQRASEKTAKAKSSAAAPATVPAVPAGVEWKPFDDSSVETATKHLLLALNAQLRIQRAPEHGDVTVLEDPRVLVAVQPLPPFALALIPQAANLVRLEASSVTGDGADIKVQFKGAADIFYKRERAPTEAALGCQEGASLVIDPVEFALASAETARAYSGGCVELASTTSGDLEVPFCAYTTVDPRLKPGKKTSVFATLQFWTNLCTVPVGTALAIPPR